MPNKQLKTLPGPMFRFFGDLIYLQATVLIFKQLFFTKMKIYFHFLHYFKSRICSFNAILTVLACKSKWGNYLSFIRFFYASLKGQWHEMVFSLVATHVGG